MENELPYKNREIDEKFRDIQDSLNRIETQTMKTNGSVAKVTNEFNKWKYIVTGFCTCISLLVLPLIFELIKSGKL